MTKKIIYISLLILIILITISSLVIYFNKDYIKQSVRSYVLKITNLDSEIKRYKALESIKTSYFIENNVERLFYDKAETELIGTLKNNSYILSKYYLRFPPYVAFGDKPVAYIDIEDNNIFLISGSGSLFYINKSNLINGKFYVSKIKSNLDQLINDSSIKESGVVSIRDIYVKNKIIYVSYVNQVSEKCYNTQIISAEVNLDYLLFDHYFIYNECLSSDKQPWNAAGSGGRIASYDDENLIFTIGDYTRRTPAQDVNSLFGKIILINKNNKKYKILSKGHRNPQGIYYNSIDNVLLSTEHGPKGGDEFNINKNLDLNKTKNFGWPIASYGTLYKKDDYPDEIQFRNHKINGFQEPAKEFTPAIGISQIIKVSNKFNKQFSNDYFIGAMGFDITEGDLSIHHIRLDDQYNEILYEDIIYINDRIRDMILINSGKEIIMILENEPAIAILKKNKS